MAKIGVIGRNNIMVGSDTLTPLGATSISVNKH